MILVIALIKIKRHFRKFYKSTMQSPRFDNSWYEMQTWNLMDLLVRGINVLHVWW